MTFGKADHEEFPRTFEEILEAQRNAPPKDADSVVVHYIYAVARAFLDRETRDDRSERILQDFKDAATRVYEAAYSGATAGEQVAILEELWDEFDLPETDLRKRRDSRGPTNEELRKQYERLQPRFRKILLGRKKKDSTQVLRALRLRFPKTDPEILAAMAESPPAKAAFILIGSRCGLKPGTVRNRIFSDSD